MRLRYNVHGVFCHTWEPNGETNHLMGMKQHLTTSAVVIFAAFAVLAAAGCSTADDSVAVSADDGAEQDTANTSAETDTGSDTDTDASTQHPTSTTKEPDPDSDQDNSTETTVNTEPTSDTNATSSPTSTKVPAGSIGSGNVGGVVVSAKPHPIENISIMESYPEQLQVHFIAGDPNCTAANALAMVEPSRTIGAPNEIVVVSLAVGITEDAASRSCMAGEFKQSVTIALTEGLDGREVVANTLFTLDGTGSGEDT